MQEKEKPISNCRHWQPCSYLSLPRCLIHVGIVRFLVPEDGRSLHRVVQKRGGGGGWGDIQCVSWLITEFSFFWRS